MKPRLLLLLALVAGPLRAPAADVKAPATSVPPPPAAATPKSAPAAGAPVAAAPRPSSSVAPTTTFDAFRVITDRNIFNPNRTGRRERGTEEAPPRLDVITLVGTMDSDKGLRAFFDGSEAGFRKALTAGGTIETFKVVKIEANVVELEREGKSYTVRVGQQLRRPEGAEWNLADNQARGAVMAEPARDPNAPPAIPADASDVMKKMMERRAKQLKQ